MDITYDADRLIKMFDVDSSTKVSYIIKTILEIMNRHDSIEIHVLKVEKPSSFSRVEKPSSFSSSDKDVKVKQYLDNKQVEV